MVSGIENEGVIEKMKLGEKNPSQRRKKEERGNHNVRRMLARFLQAQVPGPSGPGNDLGLAVQDDVADEDNVFFW